MSLKQEYIDVEEASKHMKEVLRCLGFYSADNIDIVDHYEETPKRFVKYLSEFVQPIDPIATLKTFKADTRSLILSNKIPYRQVCAHHLLPAFGFAAIAYLPKDRIVGLSKLVRIVDEVCTSRPSVQELICDQIADYFDDIVCPRGVMVVIQAEHGCVACRGIASPGVATVTSSIRGHFRDVPGIRQEVLSLLQKQGVRG